MSKSRDIADSAATINYIDGVTSNVQTQLNTLTTAVDNISVTNGSLTKTFTAGESSEITLSSSILAPVVSVTKEIPQTGVTNNKWDAAAGSYALEDSAYATSLSLVIGGVDEASFDSSFYVGGQDGTPQGVSFNNDGTILYITGQNAATIYQYNLSTAYAVSTASYASISLLVSSQDTQPLAIEFNANGTKMFLMGGATDTVYEYNLSTAYNVSTAVYSQSFSVTSQDTFPQDIAFNLDGTKMFMVGRTNNTVFQYDLTTGFDLSTASYSANSFSVSSQESSTRGMQFNSDGTKMIIVGITNDTVYQYNLTTGFDITTASYSSLSFSVASQATVPLGITANPNFSEFYIVENTNDNVYQYSIPATLALGTGSFASTDVGKTINVNDGVFVLTATDGSYVETTAPTSYDTAASGEWSMFGAVYDAADDVLEVSGTLDPATAFDVSTAVYSKNFSVAAQVSAPIGLTFNTDGTKMFVLDNSDQDVSEYTLTTGFDVSTATYLQNFSVSSQETSPYDIKFNTDGTKMFILGVTGDDVNEYTLSTGFDLASTVTFVDSFSVSPQASTPTGLAFNNDGTKMYVTDFGGDDVNEYTLSTGFDVSTATYSQNFSVSAQETSPSGIAFNTTGTKMFIIGDQGDDVNEYNLSSAFDISTATYSQNFSVGSEETSLYGLAFNADGTKMFVTGYSSDAVNEYTVGTLAVPTGYQPCISSNINSTYWTDINSLTATNAIGDGNVFYAVSNDARDSWSVLDNTDGVRDIVRNNAGTWQYNSNGTYTSETWANASTNTEVAALREAMEGAANTTGQYDVSTASFVGSFSVATQEALPSSVKFNSDGTKMFVLGAGGVDVNEYTLSTGFDVSTATFVDSFSVSSQDTDPTGLAFNADGTKMFVSGNTGNDVNEYTLSTGFDVSTASFVDSFSVSAQDTAPQEVEFNADGTKMFVLGSSGDAVYEYSLTTGFDVSTASYVDSFSISAQETTPFGLAFSNDGTRMFISGSSENVSQYTLSTGFDVSTASYSQNFSVGTQDTGPRGIAFNNDGTKMFIAGSTGDAVYEYSVATTSYTNQMDSTALNAITDANQITLGDDLDFAAILYYNTGSTVPTYSGTAINYDANILNQGAVLGTDYNFDAPAGNKVRITAVGAGNYKVRVV
jgi:sugar lactone lactonase YvrE